MAYYPENPNGQTTSANSAPVVIASDQSAVPVSSTTLATAANQSTALTTLSSIDAGTPSALGQAASAASLPVVLASDQSAVSTNNADTFASGTISTQNLVPAGTATALSAVQITTSGKASITFQTVGTYTGQLSVQGSQNGTTWVTLGNGGQMINTASGATTSVTASGAQSIYTLSSAGFVYMRVTALAAVTGSVVVSINASAAEYAIYQSAPIPTGLASIGTVGLNSGSNAIGSITNLAASAALADAEANPTTAMVGAGLMYYNGTGWDRARDNLNTTTGDSGAKTASFAGATNTNFNAAGGIITVLYGTVSGTTPTMAIQTQWSPDGGTTWLNYGAAITAFTPVSGNTSTLAFYPAQWENATSSTLAAFTMGATNSALNNAPLPRSWRLNYTIGGTTPSITITGVYINYVVN